MLARTFSLGITGINAQIVEIEVDVVKGLPGFTIVGLPDSTVRESRERIRSAIENSGYFFPSYNYIVNMAPAGFRKQGANFDLASALAILNVTSQVAMPEDPFPAAGELSLEGCVKGVRGVLSMVLALYSAGIKRMIVPWENRHEAAAAGLLDIYPVKNMREAVSVLSGNEKPFICENTAENESESYFDFRNIYGHESVKRAIEIAASGNHNVMMYGPPGSGKTMIARSMLSIMPELTREQSIVTTMIHSVSGELPPGSSLKRFPPFRTPHHTASDAAIVGGGKIPGAGEVSLAHNGILFLDEFSEFRANVIQSLRQPMEDREVTISRASGSLTLPASFLMLASTNPCPCGYLFDGEKKCTCHPSLVKNYFRKIAGPVLDRIDIEIFVPRVPYSDLMRTVSSEPSSEIRNRVRSARLVQEARFGSTVSRFNSCMSSDEVKRYCVLDDETSIYFEKSARTLGLSARSFFRVLKVARTVADMSNRERIDKNDIAEAISYKNLYRLYSG